MKVLGESSTQAQSGRREAGSFDTAWVSRFADKLKGPNADVSSALMEIVKEDAPDKPLPIELVLDVLPDLDQHKAREVISAARRLAIWNETEDAWLLFQQARTEAQIGAANWREHAIPLVRGVWERSTEGSTLRSWAACWLVERGVLSDKLILSALVEAPPARTAVGHYVRRLRLWSQHTQEIDSVLARAVNGLADAWTLLGADRLPDRAAVAALLGIALVRESPLAANRLRAEVEWLAATLPQDEAQQDLQKALQRLRQELPESRYIRSSVEWDDPIGVLLRSGKARDAIVEAAELQQPSDDDARLRRVVLTAEAARRAKSSSDALRILDDSSSLLARASDETAWAYHCLKAVTHWSRIEYGLALISADDSRISAGKAGDHILLYESTILRQRVFHNLRFPELRQEADSVIDALHIILTGLGVRPPDRDKMPISNWLSVDVPHFRNAIERSRNLLDFWRQSTQAGSCILDAPQKRQFGSWLHALLELWQDLKREWSAEPLSFAHFNFNMASLAVSARHEWIENAELYAAHLKEWVETAWRIAADLQAFKLAGKIRVMLERHAGVMRDFELPRIHASREQSTQLALDDVDRLLSAAQTAAQRRWLLKAANHTFAQLLGNLGMYGIDQEDSLSLLERLQGLKQPSLDDEFDDVSPQPIRWSAQGHGDIEEALRADDHGLGAEDWITLVGDRIAAEDAVVLDFLLTDEHLYCFIADAANGQLVCHPKSLNVDWTNRLRQRFNSWRGNMRAIAGSITDASDASDVHIAIERLEKQLTRNPDVLPGPLETILRNRRPRTVYVAPSLGLHGLPLHALRTRSGWSLSELGPILRIAKTRQLAERPQRKNGPICILAGPEREFQIAAEELAAEVDYSVSTPRTWRDVKEVLQASRLVVILGHGWVDKATPSRSRIALDHGLRLTLSNIQNLGIDGTEVVLLSCWSGWSFRGGLPIGEIMGGPSAWMVGGAGAVLAPLWPVPISAATRFLGDYLRARVQGETRASAYHGAQKWSNQYEFGTLCSTGYVLWGTDSQ